ncbi:MAG TPA: hypothetical protein VF525_10380 [Pyrinomonadaceae bacterium]|jgi:hypothetical protein
MDKIKRLLLIGLLFFLPLNANARFKQDINGAPDRSGLTNLVTHINAYKGPGYESMPVQVLATRGRLKDKDLLFFTDNALKNNSDKTVERVVFSLFVSKESEPDVVLAQAELAPVIFPAAKFAAGTQLRTGQLGANLSWKNLELIRQALDEQGAHYRVALGITNVKFADGSEWNFKYPLSAAERATR